MPPAARISDMHVCPKVEPGPVPHVGGVVVSGAGTVIIGYMPAARVGDTEVCNAPPDSISQGEPTVIIQGQPAARLGDPSSHGGVLVGGCPTVLIGSSAQAQTVLIAASESTPFCEECERKRQQSSSGEPQGEEGAGTAPRHRQVFHEVQQTVDRKAAAVDRWLMRSGHRLAALYRKHLQQQSSFADLIRGRIIDIKTRRWIKKQYGAMVGMKADEPVPGSGRLRPDLFLPGLGGERVLYEIGGRTKRVDKYGGLAERIYVVYTPPRK